MGLSQTLGARIGAFITPYIVGALFAPFTVAGCSTPQEEETDPAWAPPHPPAGAAMKPPHVPQVWVDTNARVYYYSGSRPYGRTKSGSEMPELLAVQKGYRAASQQSTKHKSTLPNNRRRSAQ
jgi:hypothetical protein